MNLKMKLFLLDFLCMLTSKSMRYFDLVLVNSN